MITTMSLTYNCRETGVWQLSSMTGQSTACMNDIVWLEGRGEGAGRGTRGAVGKFGRLPLEVSRITKFVSQKLLPHYASAKVHTCT